MAVYKEGSTLDDMMAADILAGVWARLLQAVCTALEVELVMRDGLVPVAVAQVILGLEVAEEKVPELAVVAGERPVLQATNSAPVQAWGAATVMTMAMGMLVMVAAVVVMIVAMVQLLLLSLVPV